MAPPKLLHVNADAATALIDAPHQEGCVCRPTTTPGESPRTQHAGHDGMKPERGHQTGVVERPHHRWLAVDGTIQVHDLATGGNQ